MSQLSTTPTPLPSSAGLTHLADAAPTNSASAIGSVLVLIVPLVLLAAAAIALTLWLRRRSRENARIAAMSPAEREQHDAQLEYRARIAGAEKQLNTELKARTARLKASEYALARARAENDRRIAAYRGRDGSASLTATAITLPQGTFPLTASVTATVDTAGNLATSSRSTLTRIAAGGLLFGPVGAIIGGVAKKNRVHDTRELYLLIQGGTFAALITCNPDDGQRVRRFATTVTQSARGADAARRHQAQLIAQAEQAHAAEQQNTAPVDDARAAVHQATADTARLDAANRMVVTEPLAALHQPAQVIVRHPL
jgi:hypothetical protein